MTVIPDSITSIGELAFDKCFSLTEIKLSENHPVYSFCDGALFDKTKGILLSYFGRKSSSSCIIPNFVKSIALKAFMQCASLRIVEIPDSVTTIGNLAFYECKKLTTVIFGNSVTSIGNGAFYDCKRLKEVVLPDSATSIGKKAFNRDI